MHEPADIRNLIADRAEKLSRLNGTHGLLDHLPAALQQAQGSVVGAFMAKFGPAVGNKTAFAMLMAYKKALDKAIEDLRTPPSHK